MRADLDEDVESLVSQVPAGGGEEDGPTDVGPPVVGIERCVADRTTGDSGDERDSRHRGTKAVQSRSQRPLDRIHASTVEGVVEVERSEEHGVAQPRPQLGDRRRVARDRHVGVGVDRRDLEVPGRQAGQSLLGGAAAEAHCCHPPLTGGRSLDLGAGRDHFACVLQVERAGGVRGGNLAHAVTHHRRRTDSPVGQQSPPVRPAVRTARVARRRCRGAATSLAARPARRTPTTRVEDGESGRPFRPPTGTPARRRGGRLPWRTIANRSRRT